MQNNVTFKNFYDVRNSVNSICEKYRLFKIKLDNLHNQYLNPTIDQEQIEEYKHYIDTIEIVLQNLDEEDARIIRYVGLQRKPSNELGYSSTRYYVRYRKAAESFLRYFS